MMSARINLSENTSETNRDTCAQIPPALSNKPLEGTATLDKQNRSKNRNGRMKMESFFLVEEKTQAF